jgi:hypothetical protein
MDWIFRKEGDPKRPEEKDSDSLVYGLYQQLVMSKEYKDERLVDCGMRVAHVVCAACWNQGKRFKDSVKKQPQS